MDVRLSHFSPYFLKKFDRWQANGEIQPNGEHARLSKRVAHEIHAGGRRVHTYKNGHAFRTGIPRGYTFGGHLDNELIMPAEVTKGVVKVDRRERLGGLLSFYCRQAA
jgi:hypothetical protein